MIWKKRAQLLCLFLALIVLIALSPVAALYFSEQLLCVEDSEQSGDVMVVLGGDVVERPVRALELFGRQAAPRVIITGDGDCNEVRITLVGKGVPEDVVQLECESRNTFENATFTVPMLREMNARRVVLVTSWFHSRRALGCFRRCAPDIEFISLPTVNDRPANRWPVKHDRKRVLAEYVKLGWYGVRYGVSPF
ncbi:MAG TPA: YdcF family protein [Verrucomicrobiota bacterium]|nr:YdcF family protein [Verrucomicrobiota bacterium]